MPTVFDPAKLGFDEDQEVSAKELANAYYEQLPYRRLLVIALNSRALKKPYQTMGVIGLSPKLRSIFRRIASSQNPMRYGN